MDALREAQLATLTENDTSCCFALQDKVWVEDPDGNSWEVFVVKGDVDMPQPKAASTCCAPKVPGAAEHGASGSPAKD